MGCGIDQSFSAYVAMLLEEDFLIRLFYTNFYSSCEANVTVSDMSAPCEIESRPSLLAMVIHILAFFGAGITMSSWVWNSSTLDAWKRFKYRSVNNILCFSIYRENVEEWG